GNPKIGGQAITLDGSPFTIVGVLPPGFAFAAPQTQSKGAQILALIGRSKGATLAEMRKITGLAGAQRARYLSNAAKQHDLEIESTKAEGGDRVYSIQK